LKRKGTYYLFWENGREGGGEEKSTPAFLIEICNSRKFSKN